MRAVDGVGGGDEMKASDGTLTYIYNFTVKHIRTQQGYNGLTLITNHDSLKIISKLRFTNLVILLVYLA